MLISSICVRLLNADKLYPRSRCMH